MVHLCEPKAQSHFLIGSWPSVTESEGVLVKIHLHITGHPFKNKLLDKEPLIQKMCCVFKGD